MVLPQRLSVGHSEQSDAHRPTVAVDEVLHVDTHSTGALIQDGKLGLVVEESGHSHSLLLPSAQHIHPVLHHVPAALSVQDVT